MHNQEDPLIPAFRLVHFSQSHILNSVPVLSVSSANQQHQRHACSRPCCERPQRVRAGSGDGFCEPARELPHQFCPALDHLRWASCLLAKRDVEMPREGKRGWKSGSTDWFIQQGGLMSWICLPADRHHFQDWISRFQERCTNLYNLYIINNQKGY